MVEGLAHIEQRHAVGNSGGEKVTVGVDEGKVAPVWREAALTDWNAPRHDVNPPVFQRVDVRDTQLVILEVVDCAARFVQRTEVVVDAA